MKKIAISCIAASMLIQLSMADPANHSTHTPSHTHTAQALESSTQEVLDAMHAPMLETEFVESGEINVDFIKNMIPHHQGAILSSKKLIASKDLNPTLKQLAQNIITAQEKEILYFTKLLRDEKQLKQTLPQEQYQQFVKQAKSDMEVMMQEMTKLDSNETLERAYMKAMIAHHQGAIDAAKQILSITNNATITKIAKEIIATQEDEIKQFATLLGR